MSAVSRISRQSVPIFFCRMLGKEFMAALLGLHRLIDGRPLDRLPAHGANHAVEFGDRQFMGRFVPAM